MLLIFTSYLAASYLLWRHYESALPSMCFLDIVGWRILQGFYTPKLLSRNSLTGASSRGAFLLNRQLSCQHFGPNKCFRGIVHLRKASLPSPASLYCMSRVRCTAHSYLLLSVPWEPITELFRGYTASTDQCGGIASPSVAHYNPLCIGCACSNKWGSNTILHLKSDFRTLDSANFAASWKTLVFLQQFHSKPRAAFFFNFVKVRFNF